MGKKESIVAQKYIYGTNAYQLELPLRPEENGQVRKLSHATRKNREKAHHMSAGYVLFLTAALCTAAVVLISYIQLQSSVTRMTQQIAQKKSEYNSLKIANDETLNRIESRLDLEEIKRIAIGELGMVYASEGQIQTYEKEGNDYFRRAD